MARITSWLSPRRVTWIVALIFLALAIGLFAFVDHYAINLLYWDQWDFFNGLFEGADPWTLFRWQHGPQRQGVGNLIMAALFWATGWNARSIAFAAATAAMLAGLGALWLVKRMCGQVTLWDVTVPFIFLTTANYETYTGPSNLAHGPLPELFLIAYALSFTVRSHVRRAALIVLVNFFAVTTGFTLLLGGITPAVLLLSAFQPGLGSRERGAYAAALALSVATVAHFLSGFAFQTAADCYKFPHDRPWEYVSFAGWILIRPFNPVGPMGSGPWPDVLAVLSAAAFLYATFRALQSRGASTLWNVTSVVMGYTMAFVVVTAIGRVCLGLESAASTRYIPYVLPAILSAYIVMRCELPAGRWRALALALFLVLCVGKETSRQPRDGARAAATVKRTWRDCYLRVHDIAACDQRAGFPAYPWPEFTHMQQKLDWLEARRYNLFQHRVSGDGR